MTYTLKEFDLHARGVVHLVESWKERHASARAVWCVEDLICEWLRLVDSAQEIFDYYCANALLPNSEATFSYFIDIVEGTVECGADIENVVGILETQGHLVDRADELRRGIEKLRRLVEEDRFATEAAFQGGALDDWD